jgi:hypothetical protein
MGGKLVEIKDAQATKRVESVVRYLEREGNNWSSNLYWIGLSEKDGKFVWTSTGGETDHTNWHEGYPTKVKGGSRDEEFVVLYKDEEKIAWANWPVDSAYALCQRGWW